MINPIEFSENTSINPINRIVNSNTSTPFSQISNAVISLEDSLSKNSNMVSQFAKGDSTIATHELMIKMETTRLDLMLALQVRNKVVEAVQEIYRTQI
jgi:flagellar hook-basal body complex protein FliE